MLGTAAADMVGNSEGLARRGGSGKAGQVVQGRRFGHFDVVKLG